MTVTIAQVSWSQYGGYEGPKCIGTQKVTLPDDPTFDQKVLYAISATEGNLDSINMYDRAICSVGAIQWIELGQHSVSDMLGYVAETRGVELVESHLLPALTMSKSTFKKTAQGRWRFHFVDGSGQEISAESEAASRWLFAKGSGKVGTWTDESRLWAKLWTAALCDLFQDEQAKLAQIEWTVPQLRARFVGPTGKAVVFAAGTPFEGYAGVLKACLVAYGVNLPAISEKSIALAIARCPFPRWSKQWCLDLVHDLALSSGVSLWPGRYDLKRPSLEKAFGVTLPKNQFELGKRAWASEAVVPIVDPEPVHEESSPPDPTPADIIDETAAVDEVVKEDPVPEIPSASASGSGGLWSVLKAISDVIVRGGFRK